MAQGAGLGDGGRWRNSGSVHFVAPWDCAKSLPNKPQCRSLVGWAQSAVLKCYFELQLGERRLRRTLRENHGSMDSKWIAPVVQFADLRNSRTFVLSSAVRLARMRMWCMATSHSASL